MAASATFVEARREQISLTASLEKRALLWLAARMPAAVNSDHLTTLGLLAMVAAGAAYAMSQRWPSALHLVNLCLLLNWFGDSLDGTLARHRRQTRPRYGFYVDHMVDTFGTAFLLGGLALSGFMSVPVATALLVAYYALSIHIYLATYVLGVFRIAYGRLGGTELRLVLAIGNLALLAWPRLALFGREWRLYDMLGAGAAAALLVTLLLSSVRTMRELFRLERL
jgi:phosphatidylglycerophosphate synthase